MKATFTKKERENMTDVYSFYFRPLKKLNFIAGQFIELSVSGVGSHWFSVSSSPAQSELSITTRITASDFKKALNSFKEGQEVNITEPMGDFVLPKDSRLPILMVAAGIGITPVLSILKDNLNSDHPRTINLIYGASSRDDLLDLRPYEHLPLSKREIIGRRLKTDDVIEVAATLRAPYIYVSGPEKMVETIVKELEQKNIVRSRIVADYFPGY